MNRNKKVLSEFLKKSLSISIAMIIASSLTACGDGSDGAAGTAGDKDADGTSYASGLLCIDENNNGECDTDEPSQQDFDETTLSNEMKSSKYSSLLELTDGSLYIAAPGTDTISAYSTIIANEILFNPTVAADSAQAKTYIDEQLSLATDGITTTTQTEQIRGSIKMGLAMHPHANPLKVVAALVSKFVETKLFNVTVTADEITSQKIAKRDTSLVGEKFTWEASDGDETPDYIMPLAGRNLTAMTMHYHNRLMVIDTSGDTPVIKSNELFANVDGERYAIDATTGASEHRLRGAVSSADGQYVYINIRPADGNDSIGTSDNYGLFRVEIKDDGTFGAHDDATTKRFVNAYVGDFSIVGDKVHVEDLDEEVTYILNLDLTDTGEVVTQVDALTATLATLTNIEEQFTSADGMYLYVATEGDNGADNQLHKINTSTGVIDGVATLADIFGTLKFFDDGKQGLAYNSDYATIIDLENMGLTTALVLPSTIHVGEVTADLQYAVFSSVNNAVWVFDLTAIDVGIIASFDVGERIRVLGVDESSNIFAFGRGFGHVNTLNIGDILTPEQLIAGDAAALIAKDINNGKSLDAVIFDLTLAEEVPAGYGSTISWSSNVSNINTAVPTNSEELALGAVTRPENGIGDQAGTLTADLNFSFRNVSLDANKEFEVSIRQQPLLLPEAQTVPTASNSAQYPASNVDGDIMLAPVEFENSNGDEVYGFVGINVVGGAPVIVSGTADTPKTYLETESLVGVGIFGTYGIGVSEAVAVGDDAGQARIFTVAMDASGVLADTVTTSIVITSGEPQQVGFNLAQSIAAVIVEKEDDSFVTEIYSLGNAGEISLLNTINMTPASYANYGPPQINDDASRVYQRDGDNVIMTAVDGATATVPVDEIARVWFYNDNVFVTTYDGKIVSFNETLDESSKQVFDTGTGGRMYGGAGREFNGKNYLYIPMQRAADYDSNRESELHGIYQLEIMADGSLKEVAFSQQVEGINRMTVSGDGSTVFTTYRDRTGDDAGYHLGVFTVPAE